MEPDYDYASDMDEDEFLIRQYTPVIRAQRVHVSRTRPQRRAAVVTSTRPGYEGSNIVRAGVSLGMIKLRPSSIGLRPVRTEGRIDDRINAMPAPVRTKPLRPLRFIPCVSSQTPTGVARCQHQPCQPEAVLKGVGERVDALASAEPTADDAEALWQLILRFGHVACAGGLEHTFRPQTANLMSFLAVYHSIAAKYGSNFAVGCLRMMYHGTKIENLSSIARVGLRTPREMGLRTYTRYIWTTVDRGYAHQHAGDGNVVFRCLCLSPPKPSSAAEGGWCSEWRNSQLARVGDPTADVIRTTYGRVAEGHDQPPSWRDLRWSSKCKQQRWCACTPSPDYMKLAWMRIEEHAPAHVSSPAVWSPGTDVECYGHSSLVIPMAMEVVMGSDVAKTEAAVRAALPPVKRVSPPQRRTAQYRAINHVPRNRQPATETVATLVDMELEASKSAEMKLVGRYTVHRERKRRTTKRAECRSTKQYWSA